MNWQNAVRINKPVVLCIYLFTYDVITLNNLLYLNVANRYVQIQLYFIQ